MEQFRVVGIYLNAKTRKQEQYFSQWLDAKTKTIEAVKNDLCGVNAFFIEWHMEFR